jgi:hypothetical protein
MIRLGYRSAAAVAALLAAGCASVADTSRSAHNTPMAAPAEASSTAPAADDAAASARTSLAALGLRGVSAPATAATDDPPVARLASAAAPGVIVTAPNGGLSDARFGRASPTDGGYMLASDEAPSPAAPPTDQAGFDQLLAAIEAATSTPASAEAPVPAMTAEATSVPESAPAPLLVEHAAAEPASWSVATPAPARHEAAPAAPAGASSAAEPAPEPMKLAMVESAPPAPPMAVEASAEAASEAPKGGETSMWYAGRPDALEAKSPVAPAPSGHPTLEQVTQFQYCAPVQRLPGRIVYNCE